MLAGLDCSLTLDFTGRIYLLSESQSALRLFLPRSHPDLHAPTQKAVSLTSSTPRPIIPTWVKGHGANPGNIRVDLLARTATRPIVSTPNPSYSYLLYDISTCSSREWTDWFLKSPHYYIRQPTSNRHHHKGSTRLDSIVLFKLRSNKGWHPTDPIGTQPPPPCSCDHSSPCDGHHILSCPIYSLIRSPEITTQIHLDTHLTAVMRWIRHHKHFGMKPRTSPVKWVKLSKPGNLALSPQTAQCPSCQKVLHNKRNLTRHMKTAHPNNSLTTSRAWDPSHACPHCTLTHPNKGKLDDHIASVHSCPECSYHCATGGTPSNPQVSIHNGIPCPGCTLRFFTKLSLRQHQRSNCGGSRS